MMQVLAKQFSKEELQGQNKIRNKNLSQINDNGETHLEKYKVVKMMSSGDYICNDQIGHNYLLVCQTTQGGYIEFKAAAKHSFIINNKNKALIIPFEDIEHGGLKFTVYRLPKGSISFIDIMQKKSNSEIFCLSLIYTVVNKVIKPLLQIFNRNADKWLHFENIWVKQSTIFYILNQRKKVKHNKSLTKTENKKYNQQIKQKQNYEKFILRKLCIILIPHFKIDLDHKSFLNTIVNAMLNQQISIEQLCFLLNDKKKRKSFMNQKNQDDKQTNQNNQLYFVSYPKHQYWKQRQIYVPDSNNRRFLRNQTLNIEDYRQQNRIKRQNQNKKIGQTITIPPSFQSRRASLRPSRMFDPKSIGKKRKSLSNSKRFSQSFRENSINVSQNFHRLYQTGGIAELSPAKNQSASAKVQQRAYKRFILQNEGKTSRYQTITIQQQDKKLRAFLVNRSQQKNIKSSTIQIGELKNIRFRIQSNQQHMNSLTNNQIQNKFQLPKVNDNENSGQFKFKTNFQKLQYQMKQNQLLMRKQEQQRQKQIQNYKLALLQAERQKQRLNQLQQRKQLERQKQLNRIKQQEKEMQQREKERQRQKQRQIQLERQKQKQRQRQRQKQRQIEKQKQQKQRQKQKQRERLNNQIAKSKQLSKQHIVKSQSSYELKNKNMLKPQNLNLDEIQIIEPKLKKQLEEKKKQLQQKQRLQKINKPPLPNQNKDNQHNKGPVTHQSQIQQIVLIKNDGKNLKPVDKKNMNNVGLNKIDEQKKQHPKQKQIQKKQEEESNQRTKTVTSQIASSCGPKKSVSKQVAEYMHMINKMGEGVAKSSRLSAKLQGIQWFTGIYFVYKRFLFQRKKIEKWLATKQPNLTRYSQKNLSQWNQWYNSQQKKSLQQKVKLQNENIVSSIIKMNKKIMKKELPGNFLHHAALSRHSEQQSKIAVSQVVKQYDLLDEKQKLKDDEVLVHINQLMSALYIIAELDGKIKQRKPLVQILKKKSQEELPQFSDFIYQLYIKQ